MATGESVGAQPPGGRKGWLGWTPYQAYIVGVLLLVNLSSALDRGILSILQEPIKADLKLTDTHLGLVTGPAFALLYSLAGLPLARLAERVNRAKLLTAVVALWSGMTALCGAAHGFAQLALFRVGVGMGEGGCHPISHSLIANYFSASQRGLALAAYSLGSPLAGILAPLIGGFVAYQWGWRAAFLFVGLPGLLLAALIYFTVREPRAARAADAPPRTSFLADFKWLTANRAFVFVFLAAAFNGVGIQGIGVFVSSFVIRVHGLDLRTAGVIVSVAGIMGLIGTFLGGYLADRFADGRGRSYVLVPAVGAALSFVFFQISFNVPVWSLALAFLMLANCATDLKNGPNFAAVQNIVPDRMRATAAAMFTLASNMVGIGLGALATGAISDNRAAQAFAYGAAEFRTLCPGGRAVEGAAESLSQACLAASAEGLRQSLVIVSFAFIGAAVSFYIASRTITVNEE